MKRAAYFQLAGLMFFQFVVAGAYQPVIGTYLRDTLHFSGTETGLVLTVFQMASMAAPLVAAFVVDRLVSARLLFAGVHLVASGIAFSLIYVSSFWPFLGLFAAYAFSLGSTFGLINALAFARMPDRRKQYGQVRLWGTVGWIFVAFMMSALWLLPGSSMEWMFAVAGVSSLLAAGVSAFLPHVPTVRSLTRFELIPKAAFRVFREPNLIKFGLLWFVSGILDRFYYIATSPYLHQLGFSPGQIMPLMTLGQFTEVGLLLLTGPLLKRWGLRNVLMLGLFMQLARFVLLWTNFGPIYILVALSLNGFVFAFFYSVGTIFVDGHTTSATRGGVHQLMGLFFAGAASVVGSLVTGLAFDWFTTDGMVNYHLYYLLPVLLAVIALALVPVFFGPKTTLVSLDEPPAVR